MSRPNKMMITVGAIALTATTLLAGCGGSSNDAAEPAEPAASDATARVTDGLVKPADVSDENWAAVKEGFAKANGGLADLTPEQLAKWCEAESGQTEGDAARAEESAEELGGPSRSGWLSKVRWVKT